VNLSRRTELPDKEAYFDLFQTTGWSREGLWSADALYQAAKNSWFSLALYDCEKLAASGRIVSEGFVQTTASGGFNRLAPKGSRDFTNGSDFALETTLPE